MPVTILGQHIRLIRPEKIRQPIIFKQDQPRPTYNKRPKTIKENSGRVTAICIKLKNGGVRAIKAGEHVDVMNTFDIDPLDVDKVGWELEGERFVWR